MGAATIIGAWDGSQSETTMGKGDVRTRRGKIFNGSYGKKRPHKKRKKPQPAGAPTAKGSA